MNKALQRLCEIGSKPSRVILGMMSGTSLDGLDLALCRISGAGNQTQVELLHFKTLPYSEEFRQQIQRIFAKSDVRQADISGLNALIAGKHAKCVIAQLAEWGMAPENVDFIASHGQTVFHAPRTQQSDYPNNTLQLGDGDHIAVKTGIITISDFRQKHIAAGGEGAPLVVYGDSLLFSDPQEIRLLLNLGGIANITCLPNQSLRNAGVEVFASDLGPANTLMNQYMHLNFGLAMDRDADLAKKGQLHEALLEACLDDSFFHLPYPKTTGPEYFDLSWLGAKQAKANSVHLSAPDLMATLCAFTARIVVSSVKELSHQLASNSVRGANKLHLYISGGGVENPLLMQLIHDEMDSDDIVIRAFDELGIPAAAKEAVLFAVLANQTIAGEANQMEGIRFAPAVNMGKISLPW